MNIIMWVLNCIMMACLANQISHVPPGATECELRYLRSLSLKGREKTQVEKPLLAFKKDSLVIFKSPNFHSYDHKNIFVCSFRLLAIHVNANTTSS